MTPAVRIGRWRVWLADTGGDEPRAQARMWLALAERLAATATVWHRSKHAVTHRVLLDDEDIYFKSYHRYRRRTDIKDMVRASKARHVLRVSAALAVAGFSVPRVMAVAEERYGPLLRGAWVATVALAGMPVAERIAALAHERAGATHAMQRRVLATKRSLLASLGATVGRLHACGFVAGDLVPANVWCLDASPEGTIAFLDHDRTRAGSPPAPWVRARRNLVQLNRVVLAGVVTTDRLRVYRAYAAARGWSAATARRHLPWVVAKTIDRRRRFDGVQDAAALGFRAVMRAPGSRA